MTIEPLVSAPVATVSDATFRHCLACGYNLTGLGDGPRCPECGLVHVPEALRKQVWDLVDSGKWFFSRMFHPFEKRPPGWWWALDRPGDVKRSFRFAECMVAMATLTLYATWIVSGGIVFQGSESYVYHDPSFTGSLHRTMRIEGTIDGHRVNYRVVLPMDEDLPVGPLLLVALDGKPLSYAANIEAALGEQANGSPRPVGMWIQRFCWDLLGRERERVSIDVVPDDFGVGTTTTKVNRATVAFGPRWGIDAAFAAVFVALLTTWLGPALVGIWTQIRRGLPAYARAPRTIIAAANYESHRLVYRSLLLLMTGALVVAACALVPQVRAMPFPDLLPFVIAWAAAAGAACGWSGPLRSDFTRQLIRSRTHAIRIVIMYAVLLPLFGGAAAWGIVFLLTWP